MIYYVTFELKTSGQYLFMLYYCTAGNAKEAVQIARDAWTAAGNTCHPFHLHGAKSKYQCLDPLRIIDVSGAEYKARDVLNRFINYKYSQRPE